MVKQKIFDTALKLIDEQGVTVSVRTIASAAEVNVAAINYHFGSKENLINQIIVYKLEQFRYAFDRLEDRSSDPLVRLEQFVCELVDLIGASPELADYIINQHGLFTTRYQYQNYLQSVGYDKLVNLMIEITGITDQQMLTIMIEHVLSSSVMSYINQLKIASQNSKFRNDVDQKYPIHVFIENYFYRFIEREGN